MLCVALDPKIFRMLDAFIETLDLSWLMATAPNCRTSFAMGCSLLRCKAFALVRSASKWKRLIKNRLLLLHGLPVYPAAHLIKYSLRWAISNCNCAPASKTLCHRYRVPECRAGLFRRISCDFSKGLCPPASNLSTLCLFIRKQRFIYEESTRLSIKCMISMPRCKQPV